MNYVINPGCELFTQFTYLRTEILRCDAARKVLLLEIGIPDNSEFYSKPHCLGTGLTCIVFPQGNPDSKIWKKARLNSYNEFAPRKRSELNAKFESLPVVKQDVLNALINFTPGTIKGTRRFIFSPRAHLAPERYLIRVDMGLTYTPVPGMEEITDSEWLILLGE